MKTLLAGIALIFILGIGGFFYRAETENVHQQAACPLEAKICPDGTSVGRMGNSCTFPACAPPNVTMSALNISFALPDGYVENELPDASAVAAYGKNINATSTIESRIVIHRYPLAASTTAIQVIHNTALGDASGEPVSATAYSSAQLGTHRFTIVAIGRFEGVVSTAYYLTRNSDVLRFDAVDHNVPNWTDPGLNVATLPGNVDLRHLLTTLQGE